MSELLFEIGTEELPAGFQKPALAQLEQNFVSEANSLNLEYESVRCLGTPRRLALLVTGLADRQPDSRAELIGPSKQAGFDDEGNPSKAAIGFARSKGADVRELQVVETEKGEYLMLVQETKGLTTTELLPAMLSTLMRRFSFAKSMRWGAGSFTFARPIQWLLAIHDGVVIPFSHEGIDAGNTTRGHRFMANSDFTVAGVADYEQVLTDAFVQVDQVKRRKAVKVEIEAAVAASLDSSKAQIAVDEELVDTVCNLVETPYGVCGSFDEKFLQLPAEALITSMREHQKYFPVVDPDGSLLPNFVAVNNTKVKDIDLTRTGHERVLRARLEDAFFFFATDREKSLESRFEALTGIIFQAKLGTMLSKTRRVEKLATLLAEQFAPDFVGDAVRAAHLCKVDLLTEMVGEFPSLQGNMGASYALNDGESKIVSVAIQEHYLPKRAGSALPESEVGAILGLADRFDTLSGCFGIGQLPTGTKDPFGLRRIALAILHIIEIFEWNVSLSDIIYKSLSLYGEKVDGSGDTVALVLSYIRERFVNDQLSKGEDAEAVEAVTSVEFDDVIDCKQKIAALAAIRSEDAFAVLAASFKRIRNIIKENSTTEIDTALFREDAEIVLAESYRSVESAVQPLLVDAAYEQALSAMLELKDPVDTFFDSVMVMDENVAIRQNRLNLLTAISSLFLKVGDISKMQNG